MDSTYVLKCHTFKCGRVTETNVLDALEALVSEHDIAWIQFRGRDGYISFKNPNAQRCVRTNGLVLNCIHVQCH